ncbi:hypothetical protein [Bacillus velezensis]|uniref:hypothetical protein n=1 Tax=Bacillus velezensis TaxID=492670 RepID=UPI0004587B46|nr:hypothetical protein [Bacillus velezensis]AHZ16105.1 hypothetical protein V529_20790 [Bacillus velezensis SQR9]MDH2300129.1 hypothetical protein [Bacillus velezensis]MDR4960800.1 hypothetical protein [Bacillus velezensis]MEC2162821.1 hypothetical protein [Bacillus velezensis]MEC2196021.1 hypothetical protein [Bacillus velezensis]
MQNGFKKFKVGFRGGIELEFTNEDIVAIEEQPGGQARITLSNGDRMVFSNPVNELKEIFQWSDKNLMKAKEGLE